VMRHLVVGENERIRRQAHPPTLLRYGKQASPAPCRVSYSLTSMQSSRKVRIRVRVRGGVIRQTLVPLSLLYITLEGSSWEIRVRVTKWDAHVHVINISSQMCSRSLFFLALIWYSVVG